MALLLSPPYKNAKNVSKPYGVLRNKNNKNNKNRRKKERKEESIMVVKRQIPAPLNIAHHVSAN